MRPGSRPAVLRITVDAPLGIESVVPRIEERLGAFEVLSIDSTPIDKQADGWRQTWRVTLAAFDKGEQDLPRFALDYTAAGGQVLAYWIDPLLSATITAPAVTAGMPCADVERLASSARSRRGRASRDRRFLRGRGSPRSRDDFGGRGPAPATQLDFFRNLQLEWPDRLRRDADDEDAAQLQPRRRDPRLGVGPSSRRIRRVAALARARQPWLLGCAEASRTRPGALFAHTGDAVRFGNVVPTRTATRRRRRGGGWESMTPPRFERAAESEALVNCRRCSSRSSGSRIGRLRLLAAPNLIGWCAGCGGATLPAVSSLDC